MAKFWVGNGGNWDDTNHWASSSGGSGGTGAPANTDAVTFDANSFSSTGQTVSIRQGQTNICLSLDMSAVTNSPTLSWFSAISSDTTLTIDGSMTIPATVAIGVNLAGGANAQLALAPAGTATLTIAPSLASIRVTASTGTISLASTLTVNTYTHSSGTFTTNNFAFTTGVWSIVGGTLNLGSSTITINGAGVGWQLGNNSAITLNAGTSTVILSGSDPSGMSISNSGGNSTFTFYDIHVTGSGNTQRLQCQQANLHFQIHTLTIDPGCTVKFLNGIFEISGDLVAHGNSPTSIVIASQTNGSAHTINMVNNVGNVSGVSFRDTTVTGKGITSTGGTNVSNNSGITFISNPTPSTNAGVLGLLV